MNCEHKNFKSQVNVIRITDNNDNSKIIGYRAEIEIWCDDCKMPFEFVGFDYGVSGNVATISADHIELRLPIKPMELPSM